MGEWRSALAANDYKRMLEVYKKLNDQEKYAALAQCNELQKKYILRSTAKIDQDFVKRIALEHMPEGYLGIGYGLGDNQEYQDGNLPLSQTWILVKDFDSKPQDYDYSGEVETWLHEEIMDARGRWGEKPDIEEGGSFDFWNKPPKELKLLSEFAQDWCEFSHYLIFRPDGSIVTLYTWQGY